MKKIYSLSLLSIFALLFTFSANAQLTGTKNIPGDYATLAAAITDLNTVGVGAGGVIINLNAAETAPAGGYVIGGAGSLVLTTASSTNTIVINGNSNTVTAPTPQVAGNINDAIFKLVGADWVTINGFTMRENPANTTIALATNNMTEWGVALFYTSVTDGAQNNTIQNNTIILDRTYPNSAGIYSNTRTSATAVTTAAEATSAAGSNSFNKVYTNNISNVNYGIVFIGTGTNAVATDFGNDIGGGSAGTGNTITNWGGIGTATSSYTSLTANDCGIFMNQQLNDNISYNTITSFTAGVMATVTMNGIFKGYSVAAPAAATSTSTAINFNNISLAGSTTTGFIQGIQSTGMTTGVSAATFNISNNNISLNMNGAVGTTGAIVGIVNSSSPGRLNMNNNIMTNFSRTSGTTGQVQGITQSGSVVNNLNINDNQFGNASADFANLLYASSGSVFGISNSGAGSASSVVIQNNDIRRINYTVAGSSAHTYFASTGAALNTTLNNNTFTNLNVNTTGSITFLSVSFSSPVGATKVVTNNSIVTGFNKPGAGGTVIFLTDQGSSDNTSLTTVQGNNFSNGTLTGATTLTGLTFNDGGTTPAKNFRSNTFNNWTTGAATVQIMNLLRLGGATSNISNNTITNINGQGAISGIVIGNTIATSTTVTINTNTINNLISTGTGGAVTGISCTNTSPSIIIGTNTINTLSTTAGSAVIAISIGGSTATTVSKNKIYDLSGSNASSTVNGILVSGGTLVNVQNNLIGDLRTPAANASNPLIGLNITGGTVNAYFNTVRLAGTSSGALFGSSAVSISTGAAVTMRNNIFINGSAITGAGLAVAYRRSSTTLTSYNNASNKNLFLASTIYTDGTNTDVGFPAYQTRVAPRDANSISVAPNFLSTVGSAPDFLHINTTIATPIDAGADAIAGITDDFDGDLRDASTPDIGADEFTVVVVNCTGLPSAGAITPTTASKCVNQTYTMTATGLTTGSGISYQWMVSTTSGGPYSNVVGGIGATTNSYITAPLTAGVYYYVVATTCTPSSQTNYSNEVTVTVNANPAVAVTPTAATFCNPGGTPVSLTASGASTYAWTPAAGLSAVTGANVTASPTSSTTYIVTGTDGNNCTATASSVITVAAAPVISSVTATPATVCSGSNSQLQANVAVGASGFSFTGTSGTYTPIAGGTDLGTAAQGDDKAVGNLPIGFSFTYNGTPQTVFAAASNGFIELGSTLTYIDNASAGWTPSTNSLAGRANIIAPFWEDNNTTGGTIKYITTGVSPNQVLTVQWTGMHVGNGGNAAQPTLDMQVQLFEGTNQIRFIYGSTSAAFTNTTGSIGLSGAVGNFLSVTPLTPVNTSTTSSVTENTGISDATNFPSGTIYNFAPPVYTYSWSPTTFLSNPLIANPVATAVTANTTYTVSVSNGSCTVSGTPVTVSLASYNGAPTTQPSTAAVTAGSTGNQVLMLDLPQACSAQNMTQLDFTNVSTTVGDIAGATVYYTTTNTFATTTVFGTIANPAAAFSITGTQALSTTTHNYFWLVYDAACNAPNADIIDAGLTSFTIGGTPYTPATVNPAGTRPITGLATLLTTNQSSVANATVGGVDQQIVRVLVPATGCGTLTAITFNTNGSTNAATDLANARVYYTTTTTFATTTQFGASVASPNGSFTVNGSQLLSSATSNYFWLVYDISCGATAADVVDAEVNSLTIAGNAYVPATINPAGTRPIVALYTPTRTDGNGSGSVTVGTPNAQFVYATISGSTLCPGTVTAVDFTATNPNPTDVVNAKCYYTTTSTFSTATQFGSSISNPASGALTFTGSQVLANGANYFWVVYDINCSGTVAASVNADINSLTVNATVIPVTGTATAANALAAAASYTTVADGDWNSPATWICGNIPPSATTAVVLNNNVTVTTAGNIAGDVTVNSGFTLTIAPGGTLTMGTTSAGASSGNSNHFLIVNGTLTMTGGTLNLNGGAQFILGSTFNMSSGTINADPNDGTSAGSYANANGGFAILTQNVNVTGGNINLLDPMWTSTTSSSTQAVIAYSHGSIDAVLGTGCTVTLGGGDDVNPLNTNGFYVECNVSVGTLEIGNLVVNGGLYNSASGSRCMSTRQGTLIYITKVRNLTINSGSELLLASGSSLCGVTGNLVNNGLITNSATAAGNTGLVFAGDVQYISSAVTILPGSTGQFLGGTGFFRKLVTDPVPTAQTGNLLGSLTLYQYKTSAGLTLGMPLVIDGSLRLIAGKINTSITNTLSLGHGTSIPGNAATLTATAGSVFGLSTTAYTTAAAYDGGNVSGPFNRWFLAATNTGQTGLMPVGSDTSRPAQVLFTVAPSAAGYLTATWVGNAGSSSNVSPTLNQAGVTPSTISYSMNALWTVENLGTLTGGTYTISVNNKNASYISDFANTVLLKRATGATGTAWEDDGAGGPIGTHVASTGSNTSITAGRSGLTSFSQFAIGGGLGIVPVSIEYFRGSKLAAANYLTWRITCTSSPSVDITLERSADARSFKGIDQQNATAARCLQEFNYTDRSPLSGINYYRLKIVSPDGKVSYSSIVALINKDKGFELISVAPNPVQSQTTLTISTVKGGTMMIAVTDMNGKMMMQQNVTVIGGSNAVNLNFSKLAAGTYRIIAIDADGEKQTTGFVKY